MMKDMRTRTSMERKTAIVMTANANAVIMTSIGKEVMRVVTTETMMTTTKIMTARKSLIIPIGRAADRMTIQVLKENMEEVTTRIQAAVVTRVMTPPVKQIEDQATT